MVEELTRKIQTVFFYFDTARQRDTGFRVKSIKVFDMAVEVFLCSF